MPAESGISNVSVARNDLSDKYFTTGTVNGSWVGTILRDSGALNCVIVSEDVLPDADTSNCVGNRWKITWDVWMSFRY